MLGNFDDLDKDEFVKEWVSDLRSGKLTQTQGILHVTQNGEEREIESFCCLGVACKRLAGNGVLEVVVSPVNVWAKGYVDGTEGSVFSLSDDEIATGTLPAKVADWLGMSRSGLIGIPLNIDSHPYRAHGDETENDSPYPNRQYSVTRAFKKINGIPSIDESTYLFQTDLTCLNDGGLTFEQIADVIEFCWRNDYFQRSIGND